MIQVNNLSVYLFKFVIMDQIYEIQKITQNSSNSKLAWME